jgi:hypothetical protein
MAMNRDVPNPFNRKLKIAGAYTRITRLIRETVYVPQLGKVVETLTIFFDTYLSKEAFKNGEQPCAPSDTVQLNDEANMVLDQEQKNTLTGELIAPALQGPKLGQFDTAAEAARQPTDKTINVLKRAAYAIASKKAMYKDATPNLDPGDDLIPVVFPPIDGG